MNWSGIRKSYNDSFMNSNFFRPEVCSQGSTGGAATASAENRSVADGKCRPASLDAVIKFQVCARSEIDEDDTGGSHTNQRPVFFSGYFKQLKHVTYSCQTMD